MEHEKFTVMKPDHDGIKKLIEKGNKAVLIHHIFLDSRQTSLCGSWHVSEVEVTEPGDGGPMCRVCAAEASKRGLL